MQIMKKVATRNVFNEEADRVVDGAARDDADDVLVITNALHHFNFSQEIISKQICIGTCKNSLL